MQLWLSYFLEGDQGTYSTILWTSQEWSSGERSWDSSCTTSQSRFATRICIPASNESRFPFFLFTGCTLKVHDTLSSANFHLSGFCCGIIASRSGRFWATRGSSISLSMAPGLVEHEACPSACRIPTQRSTPQPSSPILSCIFYVPGWAPYHAGCQAAFTIHATAQVAR